MDRILHAKDRSKRAVFFTLVYSEWDYMRYIYIIEKKRTFVFIDSYITSEIYSCWSKDGHIYNPWYRSCVLCIRYRVHHGARQDHRARFSGRGHPWSEIVQYQAPDQWCTKDIWEMGSVDCLIDLSYSNVIPVNFYDVNADDQWKAGLFFFCWFDMY